MMYATRLYWQRRHAVLILVARLQKKHDKPVEPCQNYISITHKKGIDWQAARCLHAKNKLMMRSNIYTKQKPMKC